MNYSRLEFRNFNEDVRLFVFNALTALNIDLSVDESCIGHLSKPVYTTLGTLRQIVEELEQWISKIQSVGMQLATTQEVLQRLPDPSMVFVIMADTSKLFIHGSFGWFLSSPEDQSGTMIAMACCISRSGESAYQFIGSTTEVLNYLKNEVYFLSTASLEDLLKCDYRWYIREREE